MAFEEWIKKIKYNHCGKLWHINKTAQTWQTIVEEMNYSITETTVAIIIIAINETIITAIIVLIMVLLIFVEN